MGRREAEDGEGFWDVDLEPVGEAWSWLLVAGDHLLESSVSLCRVVGVEDSLQVLNDVSPH